MLIYIKGHYLPLIVDGRKTTTMRPWKTCTLQRGRTLTFNGRVRVTLTKVEQRRLLDLTDDDARADGHTDRYDLRRAFRRHYPTSSRDVRVWVLTFTGPVLLRPHERLTADSSS
jgi:hypothetical protein